MPGTRCTVASCNNSRIKTLKEGLNVIYHSFPKDEEMIAKWVHQTKRKGKWNPKTSVVCSVHFSEEDYERDLQHELLGLPPRKRLKLSAIPRLKMSTPDVNGATGRHFAERTRQKKRRARRQPERPNSTEPTQESASTVSECETTTSSIVSEDVSSETIQLLRSQIAELKKRLLRQRQEIADLKGELESKEYSENHLRSSFMK